MSSCKNCGEDLSGKFCSNCGQSAKVGRITVKEAIGDFLFNNFLLQGKITRTIVGLIRRPGGTMREIVQAMLTSVDIYKTQSHNRRVQLLLDQVLQDRDQWDAGKCLFKYGANHMARLESFLYTPDIGNLVYLLAKSQGQKSFHMMVVGEKGFTGSPFKGFPNSEINTEKGFYLSFLQPFFKVNNERDWYCFDLRALRKELIYGDLKVDDVKLKRAIKGFDVLVVIPEVRAAEH